MRVSKQFYSLICLHELPGRVLMVIRLNREALEKSLATGLVHLYDHERRKVRRKGEDSGFVQRIEEVRADCTGRAILFLVRMEGRACHLGYRSCFCRALKGEGFEIDDEKVFDPELVYPEFAFSH